MLRQRTSLAIAATAALLVSGSAGALSASAADPIGITIDYATDIGPATHVASGFLHGIDAQDPSQYLIDGVDVHAIRGADYHSNLPSLYDQDTYDRVAATGAALQMGLYYYVADPDDPRQGYRPGDGGDYDTWREIVTEVYQEAQDRDLEFESWITWNEPDLQWRNNFEGYLAAHDVAYDRMRALDPDAKVQAPEIARYDFSFLTQFLTHCRDNDCLPDVLSWHELTDPPADVPGHAAQIRQWMLDNDIEPMPMAVTEYQGTGYANANAWHTGKNVRWLAQFERAIPFGMDSALYSAWEWVGDDDRFRASLGNAADRATVSLPRGVWWNYHAYKDMTGRMVGTTSTAPTTVDAFAAVDTGLHRSVALAGNQTSEAQTVTLQLQNLPSALVRDGQVHVRAESMANAETLTNPLTEFEQNVTVSGGSATVELPVPAGAALRVDVLPALTAAATTRWEAEDLPATATSGVTHRTFAEEELSGGEATVLEATANGQAVTYTVDVPESGVYHVRAGLKNLASRGMAQISVDGQPVGGPLDEYGSLQYYDQHAGVVELAAGSHEIEFRVVGAHPSATSRWYAIDYVELVGLGTAGSQAASITSRNSGKCLDVSSASVSDGAGIIQWTCHGNANQRWSLEDVGAGYVQIVAEHSGKCLAIDGASTANGAAAVQSTCDGGTDQQWDVRNAGDGFVELVARHSGKCLDVAGLSTEDGATVQQYDCWSGTNQQWSL
ncbi:hypothetical protein GCM10027059_13540 [Myceligenerans halotolerans]